MIVLMLLHQFHVWVEIGVAERSIWNGVGMLLEQVGLLETDIRKVLSMWAWMKLRKVQTGRRQHGGRSKREVQKGIR